MTSAYGITVAANGDSFGVYVRGEDGDFHRTSSGASLAESNVVGLLTSLGYEVTLIEKVEHLGSAWPEAVRVTEMHSTTPRYLLEREIDSLRAEAAAEVDPSQSAALVARADTIRYVLDVLDGVEV